MVGYFCVLIGSFYIYDYDDDILQVFSYLKSVIENKILLVCVFLQNRKVPTLCAVSGRTFDLEFFLELLQFFVSYTEGVFGSVTWL